MTIPRTPKSLTKVILNVRTSFGNLLSPTSKTFVQPPITPPATPSVRSTSPDALSTIPTSPLTTLPIKPAPTPSSALMGLSLLGNLDATYTHATHATRGLTLHTLTTGSRQRRGGMLLFGYTFAGKMWVSLGWDVNAFETGVVERFWEEVGKGVEEFVMDG